jgi:hypothetical protein
MAEQTFYGYFEDAAPDAKPEYDPPHDAPCPFCGKPITPDDVRTPSMMYTSASYAKRSYFYRVHRSCDETNKTLPEAHRFNADDFILCMIAHNGD